MAREAKRQLCICGHTRKQHNPSAGKCNTCECTHFQRKAKGG